MATETLRPNAAGDETAIADQYPDSTAHWDKVDEAVADDDTTYLQDVGGTYARDFYNIPDSVGSGTISSIKVYADVRCTGAPAQASVKIVIKSGTGTGAPDTADEGSELTITTSYVLRSESWATNPATSAAWTWDEIDKLQIGISMRKASIVPEASRCTQVYVEVDYTAGSATSIKTVMGVPIADIKTVNGVAIADVKSFIGVST